MAMPPQRFTEIMINRHYPYIYDDATREYDFDTPVFREILQVVKHLYDRDMLWDIDHTDEYIHGLKGGLFLDAFLPGNIRDYTAFGLDTGPREYYPLPPIRGAEGMAIIPMNTLAISQNALHKTAAWEFIKIFCSLFLRRRLVKWISHTE